MSSLSRFVPLFAIALLSVSLLSLAVGEDQVEEEREPNLFGKVFDPVNRMGIVAVIHIGGGPEQSFRYTIESDEDGHFKIHLPPGEYIYEVDARGYKGTRGEFKMIEDKKMELPIKMDPIEEEEENLFGMVVDVRTGEGIKAVVEFSGLETDIAHRAETDRSGAFSLEIAPGGYYYHVIAEGYEPVRDKIRIGEEPQRIIISMVREQEEGREVGVVKGFVGSPEGKPIHGAMIMFMPMMNEDILIRDDGMVVEASDHSYQGEPMIIETDERGHFVIRLRFGGYEINAEAKGYHPTGMPFRFGPDNPEAEVKIIMERMEEKRPEFGGLVAEFKKMDYNSDGLPDLIHIALDVNADGKIDAEYHYEDENSDGNPEIVTWRLDLPPEIVEKAMNIIFKLISMKMGEYPMFGDPGMKDRDDHYVGENGKDHYDDRDIPPMEDVDINGIIEGITDWVESGRDEEPEDDIQAAEEVEENDDPDDAGGLQESKSTSDKKSGGAPIIEIVTAMGMIVVIAAIILIAGYFLVKKRR